MFARRHWIVVFEPVASAVAGLIVVLAVSFAAENESSLRAVDLLWWVWFALVLRAVWRVSEWRRDHFVATDRRLLLIYGFIVRKVAMMPLDKVTDLSYQRGVWGRLLGYGTFVLESAGQDQALRRLDFVDHPDETYRSIMSVKFARAGDRKSADTPPAGRRIPEDDDGRDSLLRLQRWWNERTRSQRRRRGRRGDPPPATSADVGAVHQPYESAPYETSRYDPAPYAPEWTQAFERPVLIDGFSEYERGRDGGHDADGDDTRDRLLYDDRGQPLRGGRRIYRGGEDPHR